MFGNSCHLWRVFQCSQCSQPRLRGHPHSSRTPAFEENNQPVKQQERLDTCSVQQWSQKRARGPRLSFHVHTCDMCLYSYYYCCKCVLTKTIYPNIPNTYPNQFTRSSLERGTLRLMHLYCKKNRTSYKYLELCIESKYDIMKKKKQPGTFRS